MLNNQSHGSEPDADDDDLDGEEELMELGELRGRYADQRSWTRWLIFIASVFLGMVIHLFYMVTRKEQAVRDAVQVSTMFEGRWTSEREARRLDVAHLTRQRTVCLRQSTARTARCEQCLIDGVRAASVSAPGAPPAPVMSVERLQEITERCTGTNLCPP